MIRFVFVCAVLALSCLPQCIAAETLVVVVRHAEKATDEGRDPTLTAAGAQRAQRLADALKHFRLDAVFATQYQRTQLSAAVAAKVAGPAPVIIAASAAVETDARDLATLIRTQYAGKSILVVGHSNTVPAIVAALSSMPAAAMEDDEYDRFTLIAIPDGEGVPRVVVSRY